MQVAFVYNWGQTSTSFLSVGDMMITHNPRCKVKAEKVNRNGLLFDVRTFRIKDVRKSDEGTYSCKINDAMMTELIAHLEVEEYRQMEEA